MLFEKNPSLCGKNIGLPVVTSALTHGLSMAGYMFVNENDSIIISDLFWELISFLYLWFRKRMSLQQLSKFFPIKTLHLTTTI